MKEKLTIQLLAMLFSLHCFAQNQIKFSSQSVKEDLKFLYETLDKSHYNLYANTPKMIFDKEYHRISQSITDSLTLFQIDKLFHTFVALAKDGHCSIADLPISSYISYLKNGGTLFPLNVYFKNQQVFVLDNYSSDTSIIPGDEILSINGKTINDNLKDMYNYLSGDKRVGCKNSMPLEVFHKKILLA